MNRIQYAVLCVVLAVMQYQILSLRDQVNNYMHPRETVSAKDFRDCVLGGCVTRNNVGGSIPEEPMSFTIWWEAPQGDDEASCYVWPRS